MFSESSDRVARGSTGRFVEAFGSYRDLEPRHTRTNRGGLIEGCRGPQASFMERLRALDVPLHRCCSASRIGGTIDIPAFSLLLVWDPRPRVVW